MNLTHQQCLKYAKKATPNLEAFSRITEMLAVKQEKIQELLNKANGLILETSGIHKTYEMRAS